MVICIDGHCYEVVEISWPVRRPGHGGPINYPRLMHDACLVASFERAAHEADKPRVRDALLKGIADAKAAMRDLAGDGVEIHDEFPS